MESLDQIWRAYHSGLLGFVRHRVGDSDLAEDILQDVFLKAHSRLDTLINTDRIQSWLYQIARNPIICAFIPLAVISAYTASTSGT
jgi:RNA polymerase sigma-70 factor, ECF subfamily